MPTSTSSADNQFASTSAPGSDQIEQLSDQRTIVTLTVIPVRLCANPLADCHCKWSSQPTFGDQLKVTPSWTRLW